MTPNDVGHLLRLAFAGFALIAVLHFIVRPTVIAAYRHEIISMRRKLFVLGADGRLPIGHPLYWRLRTGMNGMLRFAGTLGFVELLLSMLLVRGKARELIGPSVEEMLGSIENESVRRECEGICMRVGLATTFFCIARAPLLWPLLAALAVFLILAAVLMGATGELIKRLARESRPVVEMFSTAEEHDEAATLAEPATA